MESTIQDRLVELRKNLGLTQEQLATNLQKQFETDHIKKRDIDRNVISRWETGRTAPDADDIVMLCEYFNVPADFLLGIISTTSNDIDIQNVSKYTGLSTRAIQALHSSNRDNGCFHELIMKILFFVLDPKEVPSYIAYLLLSVVAKHKVNNLSPEDIHDEQDKALADRITLMTEYFKGLSDDPTYNQRSQITRLFYFNTVEESELYPAIIKKQLREMVDLAVDTQIYEMVSQLTEITKKGRPRKNAVN